MIFASVEADGRVVARFSAHNIGGSSRQGRYAIALEEADSPLLTATVSGFDRVITHPFRLVHVGVKALLEDGRVTPSAPVFVAALHELGCEPIAAMSRNQKWQTLAVRYMLLGAWLPTPLGRLDIMRHDAKADVILTQGRVTSRMMKEVPSSTVRPIQIVSWALDLLFPAQR